MPNNQLNGKSLYYYIREPEQEAKATVVLIHGLGSSSAYYSPVIPYLTPSMRCIAVDISGSGLSELGSSEQGISSIVEDVVGQLDALGIKEKVTVVGHSAGGIVASQLAASHENRVNGVVLIGPVDPNDGISKIFENRIQVLKRDGIESLATAVPAAATGRSSTPLHRAFIRYLILRTSTEGYMSLCRVIATAKKPNYAAIKVPLLIIAGSEDTTAPIAGCEAILGNYSTSTEQKRIEVLAGVGHWHCIEAGDLVAGHIEGFVLGRSVLNLGEKGTP